MENNTPVPGFAIEMCLLHFFPPSVFAMARQLFERKDECTFSNRQYSLYVLGVRNVKKKSEFRKLTMNQTQNMNYMHGFI